MTAARPHPLARLVPPAMFGPYEYDEKTDTASGEYLSRMIGSTRDLDILRDAHEKLYNTMLYGPTGVGKTSMILAYAVLHQMPLITVPCNGALDPVELFGTWRPTSAGGWRWVDGPVTISVLYGGLLYLDEVNFMAPKVGAVMHMLLDKRRQMSILRRPANIEREYTEQEKESFQTDTFSVLNAHRDCQIIASYNPDYRGTWEMNEAFLNRFAYRLNIQVDHEIEKELVSSAVLLEVAAQLRQAHDQGTITTPVTTNSLQEFELQAASMSVDTAIQLFINRFKVAEHAAVSQYIAARQFELRRDFDPQDQNVISLERVDVS